MKIGLAPSRPDSSLIDLHIGHRPHAMDDAQVIDRLQRRPAGDGPLQQVLGFALRVGIEAKDLAQVGLAGPREQQPVLLGAGHRFFVRVDLPFAEPLQPHAGHDAAAREGVSGVIELLVIDVDGRVRLGEQHAFAAPVLEELGRAAVAVVRLVVARLLAVEDQPDDVGRMLLVELVLQLGADHVVRRSNDVAQRADVPQVVTQSAEGLDVGHGFSYLSWLLVSGRRSHRITNDQ